MERFLKSTQRVDRLTFRRVYLVLAVVALLPILGALQHPFTLLPGSELGDVYKHAWSYWHTLHTLSSWPDTYALNAPTGGVLWDVMLLPSLLFLPVTAIFGPVFSANIFVWCSLFLVGVTTYWLCRELVEDDCAAMVGGVVAQASPYLLGYPLTSGVHERLAIWIFPLLLLASLKISRTGGLKWCFISLVGLVFATAGCGVYGLFAALMLAIALPAFYLVKRTHLRQLAVFGLLAMLTLLVLMQVTGLVTNSPQSLSPQPGRMTLFSGASMGLMDSASLAELLNPIEAAKMEPEDSGDLLLRISYLGLITFALSWWGAVSYIGSSRRIIMIIVALATMFAVVSMGPEIRTGTLTIPNYPYIMLCYVIPFYGSIPVPFQQVALFAPLAAVGVAAFVTLRPKLAWLVIVGVLLERSIVSPVGGVVEVASADVDRAYREVGVGPVLEIPRIYRGRDLSHGSVFMAQTVHEQGVALSVHSGVTEWDSWLPVREGVSNNWSESVECMAAGGFTTAVLHMDWFENQQLASEAFTGLSGSLNYDGSPSNIVVFDLSSLGVPLAQDRMVEPFVVEAPLPEPSVHARPPNFELAAIGSGRETMTCPVTVRH